MVSKRDILPVSSWFYHSQTKIKSPETVEFQGFSLVREAGLEPARAYCTLEPESSESANSTTRAYPAPDRLVQRKIDISTWGRESQEKFSLF